MDDGNEETSPSRTLPSADDDRRKKRQARYEKHMASKTARGVTSSNGEGAPHESSNGESKPQNDAVKTSETSSSGKGRTETLQERRARTARRFKSVQAAQEKVTANTASTATNNKNKLIPQAAETKVPTSPERKTQEASAKVPDSPDRYIQEASAKTPPHMRGSRLKQSPRRIGIVRKLAEKKKSSLGYNLPNVDVHLANSIPTSLVEEGETEDLVNSIPTSLDGEGETGERPLGDKEMKYPPSPERIIHSPPSPEKAKAPPSPEKYPSSSELTPHSSLDKAPSPEKNKLPPSPEKKSPSSFKLMPHSSPEQQEPPPLTPEETTTPKAGWDTRSVLDHPPVPQMDPTWNPSQAERFQDASTEEHPEEYPQDEGPNMFDTASWAGTDTGFSSIGGTKQPGVNDDIEQEAARLVKESLLSQESFGDDSSFSHPNYDDLINTSLETNPPCKGDQKGIDVFDTGSWVVSPSDAAFSSTSFSKVPLALADIEEEAARLMQEELDESNASNEKSPAALKDAESLLAEDEVRSDVVDGMPPTDTGPSVEEQKQMQQDRIEIYTKACDDQSDSSAAPLEDEEDDEMEVEEEDEEEEEIKYVTADSEDEEHEEEAPGLDDAAMPAGMKDADDDQVPTFSAAAAAATISSDNPVSKSEEEAPISDDAQMSVPIVSAAAAVTSVFNDEAVATREEEAFMVDGAEMKVSTFSADEDSIEVEMIPSRDSVKDENVGIDPLEIINSRSYQSHDSRASTLTVPSADSSLMGEQFVRTKKNEKPPLAFQIPPPPPEKLKKWEEEKMRPYQHLQAVASAKRHESAKTDAADVVEMDTHLERKSAPEQSVIEVTQEEAESAVSVSGPPTLNRKTLEEASGLAPGVDGVWKEGDQPPPPPPPPPPLSSNTASPDKSEPKPGFATMSVPSLTDAHDQLLPNGTDSKMAEKLIMASSAAAQKFERYVEKDGIDASKASAILKAMQEEDALAENDEVNTSVENPPFFCAPDAFSMGLDHLTGTPTTNNVTSSKKSVPKPEAVCSTPGRSEIDGVDKTHNTGVELVGGAFSPWKNSDYAKTPKAGEPPQLSDSAGAMQEAGNTGPQLELELEDPLETEKVEEIRSLLRWLENNVLHREIGDEFANLWEAERKLASIVEDDETFNTICQYVSDRMNYLFSGTMDETQSGTGSAVSSAISISQMRKLRPFCLPREGTARPLPSVLAANFVSFLQRVSKRTNIDSPFGNENPFVLDLVGSSIKRATSCDNLEDANKPVGEKTMQSLILSHEDGGAVPILKFFFESCTKNSDGHPISASVLGVQASKEALAEPSNPLYRVPAESPSPFETAAWNTPGIVGMVLGFLGDPVIVCRTKMVNRFCNRVIVENEHVIMRDAVRLGGLSMNVRPSFWMWITLEKCMKDHNLGEPAPSHVAQNGPATVGAEEKEEKEEHDGSKPPVAVASASLAGLERIGREGKWHHVIQRDVARAFGNMPPHKTGARLRTDSIVRALVTWGRSRLIKRGVRGGGHTGTTSLTSSFDSERKPRQSTAPPPWETGKDEQESPDGVHKTPTDTVSNWGGISPVPSFASNVSTETRENPKASNTKTPALSQPVNSKAVEELALSGNALTDEMKADLQDQLGFILHALAAAHEDVGYCQGMDYIVAHLLRVLQDTVRWRAVKGTLPAAIRSLPILPDTQDAEDDAELSKKIDEAIDKSLVVEETIFRVMDTFFMTYNLRHMFWPELRCLKTCCRVFERLIQMKLPVLADHFEHHDLNVGLFALGWFQTLFLYLPSMPSATVCHMWDIWLVERSFKIFFRVGTAILFLSQPILLNHELEGMMTYLNTFPDATLLNPDILIACALQIKVTNKMLAEIEEEVTGGL